MMADYRCSSCCPSFLDISAKKEELEQKIQNESRYESFYNAIKDRDSKYNNLFRSIYNAKCSYCGVSLDIQSYLLFEIDHFIHLKHPEAEGDLNNRDNLVYSCFLCNRKKSAFPVCLDMAPGQNETYATLLNPDNTFIQGIFTRDSGFRIKIAEEFSTDIHVNDFYEQLLFYLPVRRLDYLLLELNGLIKKCDNYPTKSRLLEIKDRLQAAKNRGAFDR